MRILCTFPGKFGDLLWALPTIRALARRIGTPIDLLLAAPLASIVPLLQAQPYIGRCVADPDWQTENTAPISPRVPHGREDVISPYDYTLHLGYRGWPERALPFETLHTCNYANQFPRVIEVGTHPIPEAELCLEEPWITPPPALRPYQSWEIVTGFTDEHFELKVGLVTLLDLARGTGSVSHDEVRIAGRDIAHYTSAAPGSRWAREMYCCPPDDGWIEQAHLFQRARVFLGCCSALHVLAVAMGTPVVLMEPNPHRHHPIFYPLGMDGPQVTLVRGNDGLPTFDSRHVFDTLQRVLARKDPQ